MWPTVVWAWAAAVARTPSIAAASPVATVRRSGPIYLLLAPSMVTAVAPDARAAVGPVSRPTLGQVLVAGLDEERLVACEVVDGDDPALDLHERALAGVLG